MILVGSHYPVIVSQRGPGKSGIKIKLRLPVLESVMKSFVAVAVLAVVWVGFVAAGFNIGANPSQPYGLTGSDNAPRFVAGAGWSGR